MYLCVYMYVFINVLKYVPTYLGMQLCSVSTTGLFGQHPYWAIAFVFSRLGKLERACDCQSVSLVCLSSVGVNESWEHMSDGGKQTGDAYSFHLCYIYQQLVGKGRGANICRNAPSPYLGMYPHMSDICQIYCSWKHGVRTAF
jgi:hypothetical protein